MKPRIKHAVPSILTAVFILALQTGCSNIPFFGTSSAQEPRMLNLTGDLNIHDPVLIKEKESYYLFCTGGKIQMFTSTNMLHWSRSGTVFEAFPEWVDEEIPNAEGAWAPDISFFNGRYHLYYSLSSFGVNESAIGLAVNKTLDPESPDYEWEDRGMVIRSHPGETDYNAIDPNIIIVDDDEIWLTWGSFWGGIMIRRIDPETGMASKEDASVYAIASRPRLFEHQTPPVEGAIEAPTIMRHDGFWYLFASYDFCCRGVNSTYNVRVGRAENITGPYLDRKGVPMREGGGTVVIEATTPNWKGPGHQAVYRENGQDYLLFHAYDGRRGNPRLHISTMEWENGWPRVAELP